MKKINGLVIVAIVIISLLLSVSLAKTFSDVPKTHWAYKAVNELSNKGIINGYEDGTFNLNGNVTKAEFLKMLMVAHNSSKFKKIKGDYEHWYDPYFDYAKEKEFLTSTVSSEHANEQISRREMAGVLANVAKAEKMISIEADSDYLSLDNSKMTEKQIDKQMKEYMKANNIESAEDMGDDYEMIKEQIIIANLAVDYLNKTEKKKIENKFTDLDELPLFEINYINAISKAGLINGYEDNTFRPNNYITRAEAAVVIQRFIDLK